MEEVESIGVFDEEGNERPFGGLIRHGKVCVIFIRHFLCGYCQDYVSALKGQFSVEKLKDRRILIIGCGNWTSIKPYRDCPFPIYSENTRQLYDKLGMICNLDPGDSKNEGNYITKSLTATIVSSITNGIKMGPRAFLQGGKITQLGGEFIFVEGKCKLAHRMKNTRDHLEPKELEDEFL
ncbi:hypothetical protein BY996DRAFT_3204151 [Phakopsora pachyrhizi]|nr:hypothetical protein BY996DRAFT_3204151 [Phakopsora pachyrhizi]